MTTAAKSIELALMEDFLAASLAVLKRKDRIALVAQMARIAEERARRAESKVVGIWEGDKDRAVRRGDVDQLHLLRQSLPALLG